MRVNEASGWLGEWTITVRENGKIKSKEKIKNRLTDAGLNMLRNALAGTVTDCEIKYIALGTSSTAVADDQTQLVSEQFRKTYKTKTTPSTGVVEHEFIIRDTEAVINIQEVGLFAGVSASATANTGTLVSRILYDKNKTNIESITLTRTDTLARSE